MKKAYRHGEIAFIEIDKLPTKLAPATNNIIVSGSHGNHHTHTGGTLYLLPKLDGYTLGYFEAKDTMLFHQEHGDGNGEAKLPDGVYEIRKQQEFTPEGLVPVID